MSHKPKKPISEVHYLTLLIVIVQVALLIFVGHHNIKNSNTELKDWIMFLNTFLIWGHFYISFLTSEKGFSQKTANLISIALMSALLLINLPILLHK